MHEADSPDGQEPPRPELQSPPRPLWKRVFWVIRLVLATAFMLIVWDSVLRGHADHSGSRLVCSGFDELLKPQLAANRFAAAGRCLDHNIPIAWRETRKIVDDVVRPDPGACKFVGRWYAWRDGAVRIIELGGDERFRAWPLEKPQQLMASGRWFYEKGHIRWEYDGMSVDPPDVNKVVDEVYDGFTLVEVNEQLTVFRPMNEFQRLGCGTGMERRR